MNSKFYLHKGKNKKAENGRPWIYIDEINEYDGDYENGDIVEVYNHKNYFIGKGYINDQSKITIRIMTRDINEEIDEEFFKRRFAAAWDYRQTVIDTSSCRFIFGEADFLPGLTIDKFNDYYVIQISTLGMDQYRDLIVKILVEEYNAKGVYERSDIKTREIEGLEQRKGFLTEPFDTDIAKAIFKNETGLDIDDIFKEFNDIPIGSASIGQVYEGKLKNNEDVIVKIQRPNIKETMMMDFDILLILSEKFDRVFKESVVDPKEILLEIKSSTEKELNFWLNNAIKGVTEDGEKMQFNTAIARMMEFINALSKYVQEETKNLDFLKTVCESFIKILAPFAPHFAEEQWSLLTGKYSVFNEAWPTYDAKALVKDEIEIAIQVNGKIKARINVASDLNEEGIKAAALADEAVVAATEGKTIVKVIVIKGRLVNIVVK